MGVILSTAEIVGIAYGIKILQYATKYSMQRHHGKERQPSEEQSGWKKKKKLSNPKKYLKEKHHQRHPWGNTITMKHKIPERLNVKAYAYPNKFLFPLKARKQNRST